MIPEAKRRGSGVTEGHGGAVCFLAQVASLTLIGIGEVVSFQKRANNEY